MRNALPALGISLLVVAAAGCGVGKALELTERERALGAAAGVPDAVLLQLRAEGTDLKRVMGRDAKEDPMPLPGVEVSVPADRAEAILLRLRVALPGYFVFVSGMEPKWTGSTKQMAAVRGMGPYELMAAIGTNGDNHGLSTDIVIARLKYWDSLYGLDFREIDFDSVSASFVRKPANMLAFARDVYAFCPDVVTQGAKTVEKLAAEMDRENVLYLWWD